MKIGFVDAALMVLSGTTLEDMFRRDREWQEELKRREGVKVDLAYVREDFVDACTPPDYRTR